jgi:hypothetical protein
LIPLLLATPSVFLASFKVLVTDPIFFRKSVNFSGGHRPIGYRNACRSSRLVLGRAFRLTPRWRRLAKKAMSGGFKMKRSAAGQALDLPKMQRREEHGKMHRPMKIIDAAQERPALFDPHHGSTLKPGIILRNITTPLGNARAFRRAPSLGGESEIGSER